MEKIDHLRRYKLDRTQWKLLKPPEVLKNRNRVSAFCFSAMQTLLFFFLNVINHKDPYLRAGTHSIFFLDLHTLIDLHNLFSPLKILHYTINLKEKMFLQKKSQPYIVLIMIKWNILFKSSYFVIPLTKWQLIIRICPINKRKPLKIFYFFTDDL